jgi:hypothetical protein
MKRAFLALAALVLLGCERPTVVDDDAVCTPVRSRPVPPAGFHALAHSHNDYEHSQPLGEAIDQRFYSVEADIWFRSGKVQVSHDSYSTKGTLQELYLDPLQALVDANGGSVYGDGVQFVLWLDLKDGSFGLRDELRKLLDSYPMMTVFTNDTVTPGPVVAVLTGNDSSKKTFVTEYDVRRAVRDSNDYKPEDPGADNQWQYYALDWTKWIAWGGVDPILDIEGRRLACLIGDIHRKGKKVRFWNAPMTNEYFQTLIDYGADFVGTDKLAELSEFLDTLAP